MVRRTRAGGSKIGRRVRVLAINSIERERALVVGRALRVFIIKKSRTRLIITVCVNASARRRVLTVQIFQLARLRERHHQPPSMRASRVGKAPNRVACVHI